MAIRIPGDITKEKLDLLREVDVVYLDAICESGLYDNIWRVTYDITGKPPGRIAWE